MIKLIYIHFFPMKNSLISPNFEKLTFFKCLLPANNLLHAFHMQYPQRNLSRKNTEIAIRKCEGENQIVRESLSS